MTLGRHCRPRRGPASVALVLAVGSATAQAQWGAAAVENSPALGGSNTPRGGGGGGSGGRPPVFITTGLGASATATNNVNLSRDDSQSSLILTVTPSIRVEGQSGRVRGFLNYALSASVYSADSQRATFRNFLSARANVEAVRNWLFVDASASVSRQDISPFGTQSSSPILDNSNSTTVSTVSVAPYIQGQIAGEVDYTARAFYSVTSSGTSLASGSSRFGGIASFNGSTRWSNLGWAANFSYREVNFTEGRSEFNQLNWIALNYGGIPDVILSARANAETSNVTSLNSQTHYGYGGGVRWTPSPRADLTLQYDTRIFGSSHLYAFNYRTARTIWSISSVQSLSTGQGGGLGGGIYGSGSGAPVTAYDLLFEVFASVQPDPVLRAQLVDAYLKANGIDPNATLTPNYLPNQVTEQLSNQASVAWRGLRDGVIFSVNQTRSTRLGPLSNPGNDFANGQPVTWLGFAISWSHRLTPRSSLTATLRQQQNSSESADSTFRTASVIWNNRLAERVSASVAGRYSVQRGSSAYNEASVTGTLNISF